MIKLKVLVVGPGVSYEEAFKEARDYFEKQFCTDSFLPCPDKKAWHPKDRVEYTKTLINSIISHDNGFTHIIMTADPYTLQAIRYAVNPNCTKFENSNAQYFLMSEDLSIKDITDDLNQAFTLMAEPLNYIMNIPHL